MSDCVQFKDVIVHDCQPALTQEASLCHFLAFSGLHDHSAKDIYGPTITPAASLTEGTWTLSSTSISGTGGGTAKWYPVIFDKIVEFGYVAEFDTSGDHGAFLFMCSIEGDGYAFAWAGTALQLWRLEKWADNRQTLLASYPFTVPAATHVKIAVRPMRFLKIDQVDQVAISVWFDDVLVFSYVMFWTSLMAGQNVGFAAYDTYSCDFNNFTIPQLHSIVEYSSVDPGEPAAAGMGRVIAYERIRVQARWDGSILMWRNDAITSDWTCPSDRPGTVRTTRKIHWPNRVRVVGAYHEVDRHRPGTQGHVFELAQDPNALDQLMTYNRAGFIHKDMEERAETTVFQMAPNPALEPEDVILFENKLLRVTSINYRISWKGGQEGGAPVLESTVTCRQCLPL